MASFNPGRILWYESFLVPDLELELQLSVPLDMKFVVQQDPLSSVCWKEFYPKFPAALEEQEILLGMSTVHSDPAGAVLPLSLIM